MFKIFWRFTKEKITAKIFLKTLKMTQERKIAYAQTQFVILAICHVVSILVYLTRLEELFNNRKYVNVIN